MLPHSDNQPAKSTKMVVGTPVAEPVQRQLVGPPRCVVLGCYTMNWATVPETAVHEHRHLCSSERDVDGTSRHSGHWKLLPEAKPAPEQGRSDGYLRVGVGSRLRLHCCPNSRARGSGAVVSLRADLDQLPYLVAWR